MIKDKWIYPDKASSEVVPWALYCVKEYEPRDPMNSAELDITIYSEQLDGYDHMRSFLGWKYDTISGYVSRIKNEIRSFGGMFDEADFKHVEKELTELFARI